MGLLDKIKEIEEEMARTQVRTRTRTHTQLDLLFLLRAAASRTPPARSPAPPPFALAQKNKATERHLGALKAKLAKYRAELIEGSKTSSAKGEGFDVAKVGNARVSMIGFPSVGKSTLLSKVTDTQSEAAAYEFTTLTCIPGMIRHEGANIQLLDLPGIIEGASKGKGRGRQVIGVARTSDLILVVMDASKAETQKRLLEAELDAVGIRLNKSPPDIAFRIKKGGGVQFNSTVPLTKMDAALCQHILQQYKIHHAEILFREDASADDFIDVIMGDRKYIPALYVMNKMDTIWLEELDRLAHWPDSVVISCEWQLNLDVLVQKIWERLSLTRVYTKKRGCLPDFDEPFILRHNCNVEEVCSLIHRDLIREFKYALVWGRSSKFNPRPQRVGLKHVLMDEDVVQIVANPTA